VVKNDVSRIKTYEESTLDITIEPLRGMDPIAANKEVWN
jgi:hypothetical protein